MRILVCGSRNWTNIKRIEDNLSEIQPDDEPITIIHGGARGADSICHAVATKQKYDIIRFFPNWDLYGKAAGMIRNKQMLVEGKPDLVLAFWDGVSRGTKNMIELAQKAGVPVKIIKEV